MTQATSNNGSFLVDTGIFIRLLRGDTRAGRLLDFLADQGALTTSSIVVLEIFRGCKDEAQEAMARSVLSDFEVTAADYEIAVITGRLIRTEPAIFSAGQTVPDAIIAASATHLGATLVTLNTRQFSRLAVPGLNIALVDQDAGDWRTAIV